MADLHHPVGFSEEPSQSLDHVHRAMLPSRAAEGDGQIRTVADIKLTDPEFQELRQLIHHLVYGRCVLQKINDRTIEAIEIPQVFLPVRIGQTSKINHGVGRVWNTVLVTEGLQHEDRVFFKRAIGKAANRSPQALWGCHTGVNHQKCDNG